MVVKMFEDEPRFLALLSSKGWDITKGHQEFGESPLNCALLEASEEAGIDRIRFTWGMDHFKIDDNLTIFVSETRQEPKIKPNPKTKETEHASHRWMTYPEMVVNVMPFLRESIEWAQDKIVSDL